MRARARCLCLYLHYHLFPGSLFVRVRTRCSYEFARCSYEFAYAVRALFVRCSYAVRTSSHERELTRELRSAPLWLHFSKILKFLVSLRNWGQFFWEPLRNFFFRVQSPFHDVVAAPDRPVGIVIVWRGLRAPYCTNTMISVHSLRVRSLPVSARLSW